MATTIGVARKQRVFAVLESTTGTLEWPSSADVIRPAGDAVMNQSPAFTDSTEKQDTLDVLDRFQNALPAGSWTIPMYVRPAGLSTHPQGHALFKSLQGDRVAPGEATGALDGGIDASVTTMAFDGLAAARDFISGGGAVTIDSEKIAWRGRIQAGGASSSSCTLYGCIRGYDGTSAASHTDSASITTLDMYYKQGTTSPSMTIWIETDFFVQGMSGCTSNNAVLSVSNEGAVMMSFSGEGMQMVWAGSDTLTSDGSTSTTLDVTDASRFAVGARIYNYTDNQTNGGAGYEIIRVDESANELGLGTATGSGWGIGDEIRGYLPSASVRGEPIESRRTGVLINRVSAQFKSSDINIGSPKQYISDEIGQTYPSAYVEDVRDINATLEMYMRAADAKYFAEGYAGNEVELSLSFGNTAGYYMVVFFPKVSLQVPDITFTSPTVSLSMPMKALGVAGEDSCDITFR